MSDASTDHLTAARAALPKVIRVQSAGVWPALTLELDNGASIHLGEGDRAALHPVSPDGLAVLVCWSGQTVTAECAAPAALLPDLAPYFPAAGQP